MLHRKITRVKESDARLAFGYVFPRFIHEKRRLASIAFHLAIEVDIASLSEDQLLIEIGNAFVRKYGKLLPDGNKGFPISYDFSGEDHPLLEKMAVSLYVPESEFRFLLEYDPKSIRSKLSGHGIISDLSARNAFLRGQKKDVALAYLFDTSDFDVPMVVRKLSKIRAALQVMTLTWAKKLAWFDNAEKLDAAHFYSGKIIKDIPADQIAMITQENSTTPLMPTVESMVDLEIFFHDQRCPSRFKEFVFNRISGLYNNRASRKENKKINKKKSCSFILTEEAEYLIKEIAKEHKVRGSAFLNTIFQNKNKESLKHLIRR